MPHFDLKYTNNIKQNIDLSVISNHLHKLLVDTVDNVTLETCVSWTQPLDDFFLADGKDPKRAFAYLVVSMASGRPKEQRQLFTQKSFAYLKEIFAESLAEYKMIIFVEVREMERECCAKT